MTREVQAFQDALIVRRIVARSTTAMEHSSPEEMKKYLHDHPNADPKDHKVKKQDDGASYRDQGGDHDHAEETAKKSQVRFDDNKKLLANMKGLKKKVENADPAAAKKFDSAYDKLYKAGEDAAKAAKSLLKTYENIPAGAKGNAKKQREAALEMLDHAVRKWENNKIDHHVAKGKFTHEKMNQVLNTYGYAQELESYVKGFAGTLKNPDFEYDDSWRG